MSIYDQRPWLALYDTGQPHDIEVEFGSVLEMFGATVQRDPGAPVIRYFDPAAIVNNLEQFYASVEKLRGIATETSATLVFGHDADQIHQLRTAPDGSYR
jgi:hypothetical protein